ncbi:uncharacterized protein LOC111298950 [Durio zibethinus]|uniref:Uncharacterized protein LOC111298950 n=1 Tax=Durio zibethinus TaxID=66656 RepID=A0A6P5ZAE0_DURZI|nr:uncharacterized protein LOC111298950 [Durio zibethinus]
MSETEDQNHDQHTPAKYFSSSSSSSFYVFLKLMYDPLKIFLQNKHIFFPILIFLNLPLAFLLFSLSFASRPLKHHIFHLEYVAVLSYTRFEARHVLKESREESLSLLRLKLLFSFPSFILSLLSFVSTVHVTSLSLSSPHRPSFLSTTTALKLAWKRVVVTSLCSYGLFLLYVQLPQLFAAAFGNHPRISLSILVIGLGFEVYIMGVLGLGMVVSTLEEKFGWDAFRVGSNSMAGRRVCWWWITCMLVAVSGWIGNRFEKLTDSDDLVKSGIWAVVMGWESMGLLWFYGVVIIWSFIVSTVFYGDYKNRLNKGENDSPSGSDVTDFTVDIKLKEPGLSTETIMGADAIAESGVELAMAAVAEQGTRTLRRQQQNWKLSLSWEKKLINQELIMRKQTRS